MHPTSHADRCAKDAQGRSPLQLGLECAARPSLLTLLTNPGHARERMTHVQKLMGRARDAEWARQRRGSPARCVRASLVPCAWAWACVCESVCVCGLLIHSPLSVCMCLPRRVLLRALVACLACVLLAAAAVALAPEQAQARHSTRTRTHTRSGGLSTARPDGPSLNERARA
jgi:hypothetical protein